MSSVVDLVILGPRTKPIRGPWHASTLTYSLNKLRMFVYIKFLVQMLRPLLFGSDNIININKNRQY